MQDNRPTTANGPLDPPIATAATMEFTNPTRRFCRYCGADLPRSARRCTHCGQPLSAGCR